MAQMSLKNAVTHLENLSKDWSNPIMIQAWKIVHAKIKESVPSTLPKFEEALNKSIPIRGTSHDCEMLVNGAKLMYDYIWQFSIGHPIRRKSTPCAYCEKQVGKHLICDNCLASLSGFVDGSP